MMVVRKGRVKNGAIIFEEPLTLPEDVEVIVRVEMANTEALSEQAEQLMSQSSFGMWGDREDMRDSDQWLREQRETWHRRVFKPE